MRAFRICPSYPRHGPSAKRPAGRPSRPLAWDHGQREVAQSCSQPRCLSNQQAAANLAGLSAELGPRPTALAREPRPARLRRKQGTTCRSLPSGHSSPRRSPGLTKVRPTDGDRFRIPSQQQGQISSHYGLSWQMPIVKLGHQLRRGNSDAG